MCYNGIFISKLGRNYGTSTMKQTIILALIIFSVSACQQKEIQTNAANKDKTTALKLASVVKGCSKEAKICPDGSTVGRNPQNNCEFDICTKKTKKPKKIKAMAKMCTADVKECPDGSFVSRDHYNNCKFKVCPENNE